MPFQRLRTTALLALVPLTAGCATTVASTRQDGPGEVTLEVGPVDVPAAPQGAHAHADLPQDYRLFQFEQAGWVTSFRPAMQDAGGKPAPGRLLHHVVVGDQERADFLCEMEGHGHSFRFMLASGGELTPIELPEGYGIPVDAETKHLAAGMFGNPLGTDFEDVSFAGTLGFVPAAAGTALKPAVPVWIDVVPTCPQDGYRVDAGERDVKTREFRFPFAGTLLLAAGHLHDQGVSLRVFRKETGADLLRFEPKYAEGRRIESIAPQRPEQGTVRVEPGVTYVLESTYDNSGANHPATAMGIVVAFVSPDRPETVPELPRPGP